MSVAAGAEIDEKRMVRFFRSKHDILRFDIAMDDVEFVDLDER